MTQPAEDQPNNSLQSLRDALEQAERQLVRLDRDNIKAFLVGLDQLELMFTQHSQASEAVRAEAARWESIRNRIIANPGPVVAAASNAGGLAKLRSQHGPALGPWWHVDEMVAQRRTQTVQRVGLAIGAVAVVVLLWWGYTTFFPATGSSTETTMNIEQLVAAQKWPEALAAVETARQAQPDDADLLVWAAVLNEQLGNSAPAASNLTQAEQKFIGESSAFWILVGNRRQQMGNLDGAATAGAQALAAAPTDANATFLLGSVAEARGDMVQAADYFSRTVALAGDTNTELGVIAKVRMGNLMPRVEPLPNPAPAETMTQTTP